MGAEDLNPNWREEISKAFQEARDWGQRWAEKFSKDKNFQELTQSIVEKTIFLNNNYFRLWGWSYASPLANEVTRSLDAIWPEGNKLIVSESKKIGIERESHYHSPGRLWAESCLLQIVRASESMKVTDAKN